MLTSTEKCHLPLLFPSAILRAFCNPRAPSASPLAPVPQAAGTQTAPAKDEGPTSPSGISPWSLKRRQLEASCTDKVPRAAAAVHRVLRKGRGQEGVVLVVVGRWGGGWARRFVAGVKGVGVSRGLRRKVGRETARGDDVPCTPIMHPGGLSMRRPDCFMRGAGGRPLLSGWLILYRGGGGQRPKKSVRT